MDDALRRVLQLVADGRLTADEAGPILAALDEAESARARASAVDRPAAGDARAGTAASGGSEWPAPGTGPTAGTSDRRPTALRVEVRERDRQVVNLRLPLALGRFALDRVPGLSAEQSDRVRDALQTGMRGPILEVAGDDGEAVRIVVE